MGKAIVATSHVSNLSALMKRLANITIGEPSYYLLQRPNEITDWTSGALAAAEVEKYTHGRLFGKKGEIRWQKTAKGYSLLWLSEGDLPDGFKPLGTGEWKMNESQDVFLLGGGETKPWRDARIPRKLNYPIGWCKFPKIKAMQYKERNSQTIRFTRYVCFVQGR